MLKQFYRNNTTSEKSFYDDFESGIKMWANNKTNFILMFHFYNIWKR